jgi:hypothetical protein
VTVQTLVVELVTDLAPSPVVETVGVKEPLEVPDSGKLVIDGDEEEARPTVKLCCGPAARA